MTAHRVACASVIAVLVASPRVAHAQAGWPGATPAPAVESKPRVEAARKPAAVKSVAVANVPKAAPAMPKAAPVVPESHSMLQSLAELLTRQTAAIEALLRRLDANESKMSSAPVVAPGDDPAYSAPDARVVPVAAMTVATAATSKPVVEGVVPPAASAAPAAQIAPRAVALRAPAPSAFSRWGDLQQLNLSTRYRYIDNSAGVRTNNQLQQRTELRGRFKFDRAGRYALNTGVFSGATSISGWNNTGLGTGDPARILSVKAFYFAAAPVTGLELQYGGIYPNRGEGTQITTYDNDLYLTGQRVTVKRPKQLWFDEISATQAYLGDARLPGVWDRLHRLGESNYYQLLVGKKAGTRVGVSADYTAADGVSTWRSAFAVKVPELTVLDGARFESYARVEAGTEPTPFGWALTLDKKVGRAAMSGGFTSIDEHYGGLNGDDWGRGDRWFGKASANIFRMLAVTGFYSYALDADFPIVNQERFDLIFTYDVLKTFAPAPRR